MKAENILKMCSEPAPKEWAELPEVKAARPSPKGWAEISLQVMDGTTIAIWMGAKNGFWYNASDPFLITGVKRKK
jgi:hypothetical protein